MNSTTKDSLRIAAAERRRAAHAAAQAAGAAGAAGAAAGLARDNFLSAVPVPPGAVIAGYWPVGDEFDPLPLLCALDRRGHDCLLPVVAGADTALLYRRWTPGETPPAGAFAIPAPGPEAGAAIPDIVFVPLVAFDRAGNRLGRGAGYYDRSLAALRRAGDVVAVGIAYAAQEAESLIAEAHDQRLDWVVTEDAAIRCGKPSE